MDQRVDLLIRVSSDDVPGIWSQIEQYIHDANQFAGGKFHVKHWLVKILTDQADLWVDPEMKSAAVCETLQFPTARIYFIHYAGGEGGHDWLAYERQFAERAREMGCEAIELWGRPGWKQIGKQCGYTVAAHVFRKEL